MEGNLRFKIDWTSLMNVRKFTVFSLFYFVLEGKFRVQVPWGVYIWRGDFALRIWGAYIWRGLYTEGLIFGILPYITPGMSQYMRSLFTILENKAPMLEPRANARGTGEIPRLGEKGPHGRK